MNKYLFYLLSLLLILLICVISVSAVNNTYNNITNDKIISMSDNDHYNSLFNKLNSSFNFLYSNYSLNNKGLVLNNVSFDDFNNTCVSIENQTLFINDSINLVKSYLLFYFNDK